MGGWGSSVAGGLDSTLGGNSGLADSGLMQTACCQTERLRLAKLLAAAGRSRVCDAAVQRTDRPNRPSSEKSSILRKCKKMLTSCGNSVGSLG